MIPFTAALASAGQTVVVTLSGESIIHNSGGGGATAGIRFNGSGTIDERTGASYSQIDGGTDWIRPNEAASSIYEVRCTNKSATAWTTEAAAEDVWVDMSTNREWQLVESGGGILVIVCDFEIRLSGTTLASTQYTIQVDDT